MKVRSVAIIDAIQIQSFSDENTTALTRWIFETGGGNVITATHGNHLHIRARGLDMEVYQSTLPMWLVYSDGNYFAFDDTEFHRYYEPANKGKIEARITVQTQKEFVEGALGTVFQALVNSGLSRDQALDGLIEIQATGIIFAERSDLATGKKSALTWTNVPYCSHCGSQHDGSHETAEHDQWRKQRLNQEVSDA